MKKYWIENCDDWKQNPMAFWVHVNLDNNWFDSNKFIPEAPKINANGKYTKLLIEYDKFQIEFTSKNQIEEFIKILENKILPTTNELSRKRNGGVGPNTHWLSKLPSKLKKYEKRIELIKYINSINYERLWLTTFST